MWFMSVIGRCTNGTISGIKVTHERYNSGTRDVEWVESLAQEYYITGIRLAQTSAALQRHKSDTRTIQE